MRYVGKGEEIEPRRRQAGQVMIVFVLMLAAHIGFVSLSLDIGVFLHERSSVQNMVDAAALAGAYDLPDDGPAALTAAQQYADANDLGVQLSSIDITFRCIVGDRNSDGLPDLSDIPAVCDPGSAASFNCNNGICVSQCNFNLPTNKCNTIVVGGDRNVPFFFGPVLSVIGGNGCFLDQCPTGSIRAAACKGACGGPPTAPLDVITVVDRTRSMSSTDLANAKNGAMSVLSLYNPAKQYVGLGTLPQSLPGDDCNSVNANDAPGNWVITPLSNNYKNPDGTINNGSEIVSNINCLQLAQSFGLQTNLGSPLKAAKEELIATGRPGVKWGMIFMTDGEANVYPGAGVSSGYLDCTANAAVTSGAGDNDGYETNPGNACADNGGEAQDRNSGTGTSTSCSNSGKDKHDFYDYNIPDPGATPVLGIDVTLDARIDSSSGTRRLCVQLSWDGGNNWTSTQQTNNLSTSERRYVLGSSSDTWGHSWTPSDLTNANFRVRVIDVGSSTSRDFYLDWVAVRIYTQSSETNATGPCDYANEQATAAKALDPPIEIFTIGFGVEGATCSHEQSGTYWDGKTAAENLAAMATDSLDEWGHCANQTAIDLENADGDHFLCEARSGDLEPIFKQAAEILAGGARLIPLPD
jgi:hypothetical protein